MRQVVSVTRKDLQLGLADLSWSSGLGKAPPTQVQAPIQSPTGTTLKWGFSHADGGSPPSWLDQERASELSCGRSTACVFDLYPLLSMKFRHSYKTPYQFHRPPHSIRWPIKQRTSRQDIASLGRRFRYCPIG